MKVQNGGLQDSSHLKQEGQHLYWQEVYLNFNLFDV